MAKSILQQMMRWARLAPEQFESRTNRESYSDDYVSDDSVLDGTGMGALAEQLGLGYRRSNPQQNLGITLNLGRIA
jgi:hypothetical protein